MKIKTADLTGTALDWAVATCGELDYETAGGGYMEDDENDEHYGCTFTTIYSPSTNWAQGGPIIEREEISIQRELAFDEKWSAWTSAPIRNCAVAFGYGSTPLEAAMRCYVSSKLGDEIEIPEGIL